jgi:hypothetical protein
MLIAAALLVVVIIGAAIAWLSTAREAEGLPPPEQSGNNRGPDQS